MHPSLTIATSARVLRQLQHDKRTLGLLFVVPCVLMGLLAWIYGDSPTFDFIGAPLLGIFPFLMMFIITSITTLRERSSGTLERLLAMPIGKLDILGGYALAFGLVAIAQSAIVSTLSVYAFGLDIAGPQWFLMLIALVDALLGTALGLCASALARTEFQAVQFMPAFVLPQALLCGLIMPIEQLPNILEALARVLPLTYAVDAMQLVTREATPSAQAYGDVMIVLAFALAAVFLGSVTLRRRSK
ncbi:MAG TPA: ABC transporter permease [Candidatus Saccharimonadales bacterium]|nr:ABC transporter permease [Candidatus Saccharimonadales bacterium]